MKYYKDSGLTQEIKTFDLGIVSAGCTEKFTFFAKNDSVAELRNLVFSFGRRMINETEIDTSVSDDVFAAMIKEVNIVEAPKELNAGESKPLVVEWSPAVTLERGLKLSLLVRADKLCRG